MLRRGLVDRAQLLRKLKIEVLPMALKQGICMLLQQDAVINEKGISGWRLF